MACAKRQALALDQAPGEGIISRQREVKALVELRVPFELARDAESLGDATLVINKATPAFSSLSSPAVKRRIDRLEERGVITGYTAIVDHGKLGFPLQAFSELRFDGTAGVDEIASIANEIPEVEAVYTTAGDPDALALLRVRDVEDLKRVIDLIRRKGAGTKTLMVVGTSAGTAR